MKASENEDRTLLTLEERLKMAADSRASSPEAAASLVQRLSETHLADFFCKSDDLDRMDGLIGEYIDQVGEEVFWYGGFCRSFRLARDSDNGPFRFPSLEMPTAEGWNLCRPVWGFKVNNAVVLLGLMLLEHAKGLMKRREVYHCTRMTLGQYLDALVDISFRKDGVLDWGRAGSFRICRDTLLQDYDGFKPLGEALTDIIGHYIAARQEFEHLDHILSCRYPEDVPNPSNWDIAQGSLYDRIFLPERDYSPETLRGLAAKAHSLEMRALLEEHICEDRLASAMREINKAVTDLYILFVNPYLQMREYHYERHLKP